MATPLGVYGYIYPKSVQVNFLWGRNYVRTAIEHEYWRFIPPQKCLYPPKKNKFLATPLFTLPTGNDRSHTLY